MTTLVAFISVDSGGPTAFYLASDSRISWKTGGRWDAGRKDFACQRYAHSFGYCGDVSFPSLVLSQLVELIDIGSLFAKATSAEECHDRVVTAVKSSFGLRSNAPNEDFNILHVSRQGSSTQSRFTLWNLAYSRRSKILSDNNVEISAEKSGIVAALGTGAAVVHDHDKRWQATDQGSTSRAAYSAFCSALASGGDPRSGAIPQLAGIYRDGPAKSIGVIRDGTRYFCGLPVPDDIGFDSIEWRDELFQRIDGGTMQLVKGAQRHARPKALGHE
jgi:hypothetical protein